jgi:hypothetical protein
MKFFKLVSWLNHIELLIRLNWKKIQIFMFSMSLVDVDTEELNFVLSSSGQAMSIKKMISILKIVMKVMTIQLMTKKKKILTNYQNKALCKALFSCNLDYG